MRLFFAVLIFILWNQASYTADLSAEDIVRETTREVLQRLDSDRDTLASDPAHIQTIVRELIVPHFDFDTMASLALGAYRQKISESQHACLTAGFRNLLVERYADILLSYNNQSITYEPSLPVGERGYVVVRQTISRDGARPLPIDYAMRPDQARLKIADLVIDGVSLVKNYRNIFHYEIERYGLDQFINSFPECVNVSP